ncbi:Cupredoxin [Hyaloraphidium curvatum]|nr:Cupredoxin [Hyaloraphidium curvatum]
MSRSALTLVVLCLALTARVHGATVEVIVSPGNNFRFSPSTVTIDAGDTVKWTWAADNSAPHTVSNVAGPSSCSAANPSAFGSSTQTQGTFSQTFTTAGTFDYACLVGSHCAGGMRGQVIVRQAATSAATTAPPATSAAPTTSAAATTTAAPATTTSKPGGAASLKPGMVLGALIAGAFVAL